MADLDFETKLERMFAQAPAFADADVFARRVEGQLDRAWTMRRWAIGAAGIAGGVIAAAQMLGSNLSQRVQGVGTDTLMDLTRSFNVVAPQWKTLSYLPVGTEVLWTGVALGVMAIALVATRMLEEF